MSPFRVAAFLGLILTCTSPALAAWSEARTRHFVIYSEQSPRALQAYAERLERFDAAVRTIRAMADPPLTDGGKVRIYVLPTIGALQSLLGDRQRNALGFYVPRASGSVAFVTARLDETRDGLSTDHVFQHEYMHHLMLNDQKTPLAAWMIEGYAEFFGTAEVEKAGSVRIGLPPQVRGYSVLQDLGFNAEQMLSGATPRNDEERASLYGKGWLLTHYLAFSKERKDQLSAYLINLSRGESGLVAARNAFGDLKQLDRELDRYAHGSFAGVRVAAGPRPPVTIRRMTEGEDAIMRVRIRSDRGVNSRTAPVIAADARRIAARFPADPFVQATLAETEFDNRDYKAALAAADRAIAVQPNNVQALIYRGRTLMETARKGGTKADWAEVRRAFVRANRADLENAEPLYLYYQSFGAAGERPTKSAVDGLLYAQALAPQDEGLRFDAVRQLLIDGQPAKAEPLFATIAFSPHVNEVMRPHLVSVMTRIKAKDSQGAIAAMEAAAKAQEASERS